MKQQPNLPEPTLEDAPSSIENTLQLVSGVFKLARKIFML